MRKDCEELCVSPHNGEQLKIFLINQAEFSNPIGHLQAQIAAQEYYGIENGLTHIILSAQD